MTAVVVDLKVSAWDAVVPDCGIGIQDLAKDDKPEQAPKSDAANLRLSILAVSEGKHNGINFASDEIEKMVTDSTELKTVEKRANYPVPLVLDHSDKFLDKIGATPDLRFGMAKSRDGKEVPAALARVDVWRDLAAGDELAKRIERDPQNTYFSVRVRGELSEQGGELFIKNMKLVHIAVVQEPADSNARVMSQGKNLSVDDLKSRDRNLAGERDGNIVPDQPAGDENADFSLSQDSSKDENMPTDKEMADLKAEIERLNGQVNDLMKQVATLNQEKKDLAAERDGFAQQIALAKETAEKESAIADLGADHGFTHEFLMSLNKEQLAGLKVQLSAGKPPAGGSAPGTSSTQRTANNLSSQDKDIDFAAKATEIFGPVDA